MDAGTDISPGEPGETGDESGKRCRNMVSVAVRAFMDLLQDSAVDGKVSMDQARRIGAAIITAGGPLTAYYARTESQCDALFGLAAAENKRTDFFGRLITQTFAHLLNDPDTGIERNHLPQFFAAVRMVIGDENHAQLKARCAVIAEEHRTPQGLIDWEAYYKDPDAAQVLEQVQVTIARSFRRFEPRKDWFLIVMNSTPQSVSLGSSVFVAKKPEDKVTVSEFSEADMCRLFDALFANVRPEVVTKPQRNTFIARWGGEPDKTFGPMLTELAALSRRAKK